MIDKFKTGMGSKKWKLQEIESNWENFIKLFCNGCKEGKFCSYEITIDQCIKIRFCYECGKKIMKGEIG